jgi:hypothetical protein
VNKISLVHFTPIKMSFDKQAIVFESTKSKKYLSQASGIQFGLPEVRVDSVFNATLVGKNTGKNCYSFENMSTKQKLMDSKSNTEWTLEQDPQTNLYHLVGKDGNYYSMNTQGDFIGFFGKKAPGFSILTEYVLPTQDVETPKLSLVPGDKIHFSNYWGQYFGYNYGNPSVYSDPCDETVFVVEDSPLSSDFLRFRAPYGQVRMCGENTSDINFKVVASQVSGFHHLQTIRNIMLGTTPQGQVMLWEDDRFMTVFWKITKAK